MTIIDPGYSEAGAHLFTWLADKVLGGTKKALGWGWERGQWAKAQDRYDAQIIQHYSQIRIFGQTTPKSLTDIFTDVYVLDKPTAYRRFDSVALAEHLWKEDRGLSFRHEERRPGVELLNKGSKFFILGKPGAGKTTFVKHLAVREAQRGRWGSCLGKIPIFVSLKQFAEAGKPLFDFIVDEFAICQFPDAAPFVEKLLASGQALVLFDGLDEVSKTEQDDRRGGVTQMLAQFVRQYDECHIVITCRIAAIEYIFDPAFTYLEMADFVPDQVDAFVHAWFWKERDKEQGMALAEGMLAEWAKPEHAGIRDLGRNPLLLTLLCLNYAETLSFPVRRVEIYEEALDALLKKWDSSRQIQRGGLYKTLSLGRKRQMFARIAFDALARGEIVFPKANLERWLVEYLVNVPELPPAIDIDGEAVLREIVAQHGIFAEQAHGLYSFAHLTFQEYLAARCIADDVASGTRNTLLCHVTDDKWREVFQLTVSLLPNASVFLTDFEQALHRLAAGHPQVATWLDWINMRTLESQASYGRIVTRVLYISAIVYDLRITSPRDSKYASPNIRFSILVIPDFDFDLDLDPNLARDRNLHTARRIEMKFDLARDRELDIRLTFDHAFVLAYARATDRILDLCKRQARTELYAAIAGVARPDAEATIESWRQYLTEFIRMIEASGELTRYHQLQAELDALKQAHSEQWLLDDSDISTMMAYCKATRLFYDCLQVAYTPDRRAFEERLFWLPPDLDQQ